MSALMSLVSETDPVPPLVSVIVPAYNSARTIERCMAALVEQETAHRFEVIVVDSGEDETCALAAKVLAKVRVARVAQRAIPPKARHLGTLYARGSIFAFIDSDIYPAQDWLDHVVQAAATGYDVICGSIANANPHSRVSRAEQLLMFNEFLPDLPQKPVWFSLSGNMVLRRSAYEKFGPFVEVRAAEDVVFSRRLIAAGGTILFYPALQVAHDNRTRVRSYLRNQLLLGKHTAIARRLVPFADTQSYALFLLLLPVAPLAKLAKIVLRLARSHPRSLGQVGKEFPLLFIGICTYCLGLGIGTASRAPQGYRRDARAARRPGQLSGV